MRDGTIGTEAGVTGTLRHILECAVLAPSSHNTQPWRFEPGADGIRVHVDRSRWLDVADADRRELYLSVGCAIENLVIAARHAGHTADVRYFPDGEDADVAADVRLGPAGGPPDAETERLHAAIFARHTNHRAYDGRPLGDAACRALEELVEGDAGVHITADEDVRGRVDELVVRADAIQFADPAWREELGRWIGLGVFGTGWLMSKLARLAVTHLDMGKSTARRDRVLLDSAAALGVVTSRGTDRTAQVRAGRLFERMFLTATDLGLALQPMNQVLQVPDVRHAFEALLPRDWGVPQITFRLGRAQPESRPPRRPLEDVLVER